jgi:DNA polymerase-4
LQAIFGKNGQAMANHARGRDDRPIVTRRRAKSISQETTFARDVGDLDKLTQTIHQQAGSVAASLQKRGFKARTVRLKLRWADFTTITRQMSTAIPTDDAGEIAAFTLQLLARVWRPGCRVRLLGVGVSGLELEEEMRQLTLWE